MKRNDNVLYERIVTVLQSCMTIPQLINAEKMIACVPPDWANQWRQELASIAQDQRFFLEFEMLPELKLDYQRYWDERYIELIN